MKLVFIRVYKEDKLLFVKQYPSTDYILIGSDPEASLKLDSDSVSLAHAMIELREEEFFISDLGAEQGVLVNDIKTVDQAIKYGDNIQVGEFRLEFFDKIPRVNKAPTKKPAKISAPAKTASNVAETDAVETDNVESEQKKAKPKKPKSLPKVPKTPKAPPKLKTTAVKLKKPVASPGKVKPSIKPPPPPSALNAEQTTKDSTKPSLKDRIKEKTKKLRTKPAAAIKKIIPPKVEEFHTAEITPDEQVTEISKNSKVAETPAKPSVPPAKVSKSFDNEGDKININNIKPGKGSVVEVLVAWGNRIIDSNHFTKKSVTIGSRQGNDILLPYVVGADHELLSISPTQTKVFVPNGMNASVITATKKLSLEQIEKSGGTLTSAGGLYVILKQTEMVKVELSDNISLLVRYVPPTIRPLMLPLTGLSVQELTNVILTIGLSILMSLFFVMSDQKNVAAKEKDLEDKKERKALFVYKPPPRPQTRIKPPPPPPPTTVKVVKVKEQTRKRKIKAPVKRKVVKRAAKKGKASDAPRTKSKSNKKVLTAKNPGTGKGISRGTSPKKAPIDTQKVGLLGLFAKGGTQKSLRNATDGSGVSAAAKGATGIGSKKAAGSGTVVGSGLNQVGKSGKGESTFGIAGVKTRGRGSGNSGYGSGGNLGGRGGTNIEAGGAEEAFEGSIDREAIKRVVQRHLNQLRTCYKRALDKRPTAQGKVVINWTILSGGKVGRARTVSNEMNDSAMSRCMVSRLRSWRFPSPPDGQVGDITYPFVFTPASN